MELMTRYKTGHVRRWILFHGDSIPLDSELSPLVVVIVAENGDFLWIYPNGHLLK